VDVRGGSINVLVTGATGFIGGRLVEVLAAVRGVKVTALVRDFARVARIGRFDIAMARGSLLEPESFSRALDGIDVVFHCGHDAFGTERQQRRTNLDGTLNLAKEAARRRVRRFVHISTMAVYGQDLPAEVTEATPPRPTTAYGRVKLQIEHALKAFAGASGLDLRIARPTKVYGPYDYRFTVQVATKLRERRLWLIENGSGIVSPNYVDNLVQGLLLCAERDGVGGGTYIMADGRSFTWAEFYESFVRMTGVGPVGNATRAAIEAAARAASKPPGAREMLRTMMSPETRALLAKFALYRQLRPLLPQPMVNRLAGPPEPRPTGASPVAQAPLPRLDEYRDYTRRGAFSTALAERELGYRPRVDLATAMLRTEAWLRFVGVLPVSTRDGVAAFRGRTAPGGAARVDGVASTR
jgi:nucleoside-diphosphate-sugar epimerase